MSPPGFAPLYLTRGRDRPRAGVHAVSVAAAVALHAVLLAALLAYAPVREALQTTVPIMVSLIAPPKLEAPAPKPAPTPPEPVKRPVAKPLPKPVAPPPIVAAPSEAPSAFTAPTPPPQPQPAPPVAAAPQSAEPAPAPPPPVVPPRFNADYLQNPAPPYPALARRMGEQGRVVLRVLVSRDGLPERVELRTSSGSPRLDEVALATVKRWKFVPARQGDEPVPAWVLVPISFSLQG